MKTVHNEFVPDEATIPEVSSAIFDEYPDSQFATLYLGHGLYPDENQNDLFRAYLQFRKNVYVDQKGILDVAVAQADGTEFDENDERSAHFIVAENRGMGRTAIVACTRLIVKDEMHPEPLPIETFFPEVFSVPADFKSLEVSRFISHVNQSVAQHEAVSQLFAHFIAFSQRHDLGVAYGVVEDEMKPLLTLFGAAFNQFAVDPKLVHEYNSINIGIQIDQQSQRVMREAICRQMGTAALNDIIADQYRVAYWGEHRDWHRETA